MSFKVRALMIAVGVTCSATAHASQSKPFAILCTTPMLAQGDAMSESVGNSVNSAVKPNVFGYSDTNAETDVKNKQKAAVSSLRTASAIVFGHDAAEGEAEGWIRVLRRDPKFYDRYFDFTRAVTFLKSCLQTFAGQSYMGHNGQEQTIDAAFWQARGRAATAAERELYLAQIAAGRAWYSTIVLAEKKVAAAGKPTIKLPSGGMPQLPPQTTPGTPKP